MIQNVLKLGIFLLILFLIVTKVSSGMNIFQNEFEKRWDELSKNVQVLNDYTKVHPVELRKIKVEDKYLLGAVFTGANFTDVEFEGTILEQTKFTKTVFKNCKFTGALMWNSIFTNVFFEDCSFIGVEMGGSTMVNVHFKNCKITDSRMKELQGNELVIEDTVLEERASLAWSSIPMTFRRCTLDGVGLSGMKTPAGMTMEDCLLDEVDFGRGVFSTVTLRRVKQGEGPTRFNSVTAESFLFEDVEMTRGVSLAHVQSPIVKIVGGTFRGATEGSRIGKVYASNAHLFMYDMSEATMPFVSINDCDIEELSMWECYAKELSMTNSRVNGIDATDFIADTVIWDNVTLEGKIDFTNAHIKDFQATRLKRGPQLQLITTGSNLKF